MARTWKRLRNHAVGGLAAVVVLVLRATCRVRLVDDPRPRLRAAQVPYAYALLHAHQVAAVLANDEPRGRLAAMVSRSADGDVLVPSLRACGVLPVRGSSHRRGRNKGGLRALAQLRDLLSQRVAVLLAVDGPQGPRNVVRRGVAVLPRQVEGSVVLPLVIVPTRRWILSRSWDRLQIPKPFATLQVAFAAPVDAGPGESSAAIRERIAGALEELERRHDPGEARRSDQTPQGHEDVHPSPATGR